MDLSTDICLSVEALGILCEFYPAQDTERSFPYIVPLVIVGVTLYLPD
jgi:hypothetical protein